MPGFLFYLPLELALKAKAGDLTTDNVKDEVSKTYNVQICCKFMVIIIIIALHALQCLVININSYRNCHHWSHPHDCRCFAYLCHHQCHYHHHHHHHCFTCLAMPCHKHQQLSQLSSLVSSSWLSLLCISCRHQCHYHHHHHHHCFRYVAKGTNKDS